LNQTSLAFYPLVKGRFWIRGQKGKDHGEDFCLYGKIHRFLKGCGIIFVKAEDEGAPDGNAKPVKGIEDLSVFGWVILIFF